MSKAFKTPTQVIYVCTGSKCKKKGGKDLIKAFRDLAKGAGLKDEVEIIKTDCTDRCKYAPIVSFQPQNIWLQEVPELRARQLFQEYVLSPAQKQNPPSPEA
jgi:NADH:ubiquinone oxidoreductase subunit E